MLKTKSLWLLLFLLGEVTVLSAANVSVSGYVTNSKNGEIISAANVSLDEVYAVSNTYGFYSMQVEAGRQYRMRVSFVGYETYYRDLWIAADTTVNVALIEGMKIDEVVITSSAHRNRTIESSGLGNLRVNLSQLNNSPLFLGERDIVKTMQFLPGVSSGMEGSSQLNIRGGTNDQTLFLMDDVPVYAQNHAFGFLSVFNPDAILSADLYKGGIPSIYGNRLSGVATISMKDGNYKEHHQSLSFGVLAATVSAEGPLIKDKASYLFSARRSVTDLVVRGMLSTGGTMDWFSFWDINAKLSYKLTPKTKLSASLYQGQDDFFSIANEKEISTSESSKKRSGDAWKNLTASLRLVSTIRSDAFLSSSLYYSFLDTYTYQNDKSAGEKEKTYDGNVLHEFGYRNSFEKKISNDNTLFVGMDASVQTYKIGVMNYKSNSKETQEAGLQENLYTASAFVYDKLRWKNVEFVPGLRLSYYHNGQLGKWALEPRIKMNVFVDGYNKLMLAYDRLHQPVHSLNEGVYFVQNDFWLPYREDKLPQSNQVSIGWKNTAIQNLTLSVEAYYKRMKNLVLIKDREYYIDYHKGYSSGTGTSKGIELMAEYQKNRFTGWASYAYAQSSRSFDGRTYPFKYDVPHNVALFLSYRVLKTAKRENTLSVNARYHTGIPYSIAAFSYPEISSEGSLGEPDYNRVDYIPEYPNIRLKDYFRMDVNYTLERQLKKGRSRVWQLSLLNVTGTKNPYTVYRKDGRYRAFVLIPFLPSVSYKINF